MVGTAESIEQVLLEKVTVAQIGRSFPSFMEPENSLPCSQEPDTGLCPEPKLIQSPPFLFHKIHFSTILSSMLKCSD
jgi:hypothetical protein